MKAAWKRDESGWKCHQIKRVVLGGLKPTATPFVEQLVDKLLRCPAAINGMSEPTTTTEQIISLASLIEKRLVERMNGVMAYATHAGGPTVQESGQAERDLSHAEIRVGDYGPGRYWRNAHQRTSIQPCRARLQLSGEQACYAKKPRTTTPWLPERPMSTVW